MSLNLYGRQFSLLLWRSIPENLVKKIHYSQIHQTTIYNLQIHIFLFHTKENQIIGWQTWGSLICLSHFPVIMKYSVQLNLHKTDLLFRYLSHHLTWHCSSIYEDLHRYDHKIVFVIVSEQF